MLGRLRHWGLWAGLTALVAISLLGCSMLAGYHGFGASQMRPEALSARLEPAYRTYTPSRKGPWPTALLFSGCDGPKDNMTRWANELTAEGYAVVIVDSHGPRGFDEAQRWRLVCIGQLLPGPERAGDVAVAIEDARAMPFVDPNRIVLVGASHGGWSVLDMLSLHGQGLPPHNLTRWPESIQENGLKGIVGMVLLYPYCGAASQVYGHGWRDDVPGLFLLVNDDSIVNEDACIEVIESMKETGRPVEAHLFKGTTHGFDQTDKNTFSTLEFSPEATRQAATIMLRFLGKVTER